MAKAKVALYGNPNKVALIDLEATVGAKIGTNLLMPDGSLATADSLASFVGATGAGTTTANHRQLAGLAVGDDHPQYTRKDTLTTRGDIYYRNTSTVARLAKGTTSQFLQAGALDPAWQTISPVITLSTDATGNVTLTNLTSGTLALTISGHAVSNAKFRQSVAVSVVGNSTNSTADVADIAAAADDQILRRTASTLNFGALTVGMFPANVVTYAKIQQVSATSRVLGRITAGAGNIEELTPNNVVAITNTATTPPVLPNFTVAGLPSAVTSGSGALAFVTDATLTIIAGLGLSPTGGGANKVPVYSDGANWIIG